MDKRFSVGLWQQQAARGGKQTIATVWNWGNAGSVLSDGKGYSVWQPRVPRSPGKLYMWFRMKPDKLQTAVFQAASGASYRDIRERNGYYRAALQYEESGGRNVLASKNNLIAVECPRGSKVLTVEYGIRKFRGVTIATVQVVWRDLEHADVPEYVPLSHGLRKGMLSVWPECGVEYERPPRAESGTCAFVTAEQLAAGGPLTLVSHSLRLGLIKATMRDGTSVLIEDSLIFGSAHDVRLLPRGMRLSYGPPRSASETDRAIDLKGVLPYVHKGALKAA